MSFSLNALSSSEVRSIIRRILPDGWEMLLFQELDETAKASNIEINLQAYVSGSEIAYLALALLYSILAKLDTVEKREAIKFLVCLNLDKTPEFLLMELCQGSNGESLLGLLVDFKKSILHVGRFAETFGEVQPLAGKLHQMYEPISAVNFIMGKIKKSSLI